MEIELLVVPHCPHARAADRLITAALTDTGVLATITRTVIPTYDAALARNFVGSPTILLDGSDPFPTGDRPTGLACRLYTTPECLQGTPQFSQLREAIVRALADEENHA